MDKIYHITSPAAWQAARQAGVYRADSLETEGFIHCSFKEQVAGTAARYYAGQDDLVLLEISPSRLKSEVRSELSTDGQAFPHVYGSIDVQAIDQVLKLSDFLNAEGKPG